MTPKTNKTDDCISRSDACISRKAGESPGQRGTGRCMSQQFKQSCTDPVLPSCDICFAGRFVRLVLFLFCSLISISNIEKYLRVISNYDSDDLYTNAVAQTWKRVV